MSKRSWFYAFICAVFCSAAIALQPTVRAGSISLSGPNKPTTTPVTPTTQNSASSTSSTNRGAALSKFSQGTVVPVTVTGNNNNNNNNSSASSSLIEELKQRIADLELARTALESRQDSLESSQSQTDNAVDNMTAQVQTISSSNSELNSAISNLQSSNNNLQSSLSAIQQQAEDLNANIDSRLQYRGLLDNTNNVAFVTKDQIHPETLALRIASNPTATARLSEKITPKTADIKEIIKEDLEERQIVDRDTGELNVEKKGEVQVTEDTVTSALNNSSTFKDMVSAAATEKGFVTNTVLDNKGFVTEDSETITNLASKSAVQELQTKVDGDVDTEGSLLYKIKHNESIRRDLKGDKGEDGTSVDVDDVVNALKGDTKFIGDVKGRDATSVWYEYCNKDNNLTAIIQQVYPTVANCDDFTSDLYTKLTTGPKGQCLSWALSPDELQEDNGIGARLVRLFGSGIINNLKSYHVGTKVVLSSGNSNESSAVLVNFVNGCAAKYDQIIKPDDPKSIERVYCESQAENYPSGTTNLTIIQKLYSGVNSCDDFTPEMYTNITSGAKAYCKSLAQKPEDLDATSGIGLKLEQTFGSGIVETLKFSKLDTVVNIKGTRAAKNFVEACVENYDAIMAGKDAKSVEQVYCESQAENYPSGTTNLTIIQKLYSTVSSCDDFTTEMYTNITSGAKAYCKSLAQKPEDLSASSGIGLKLTKLFGDNVVENLKTNKLDAVVALRGTRAAKNFVEACEENYNEIMAGKDAKSVEQVYCESQAENYPEGTTNLTIIQKLFSGISSCDDFTAEMYTQMTSGAKAYCKSLAQKPEDLDAKSGIGLKLEKTFGAGIVSALQSSKLDTMVSVGTRAPKNFVEACVENYDAIMAGKDAKSVEQVYCESQAENYPEGTTNLTIIQKLYSGVNSCDDFTAEMYTQMTSGAKAYCKSLAQKPEDLSASSGIGLKLEKTFGTGIVETLKNSKLDTMVSVGTRAPKNFVEACVENYDAIMAGKDAKSVEQVYCEAQAENYDEGVTNLDLIMKLYDGVRSCDDFTPEMYTAITTGAQAYCKSLAQKPEDLKVDEGIGKKLADTFGSDIISSLKQNKLDTRVTIAVRTNVEYRGVINQEMSFVEACEKKYDEIMSGKNGENAKSAEQTYCETNFNTVSALYSNIAIEADCANFTTEQYKAMMEGAKAYCLFIAKDFVDGKLEADKGIGKKLNKELKLYGTEDGIFALKNRRSPATLSEVLRTTKFNNNETFLEACEAKYNEIMSGEDGEDAKSAEQTYCETNFKIVGALYDGFETDADCVNFTEEQYKAMMEGAKAYCLLIAKDFDRGVLSAETGIGKRLNEKLKISGTNDGIFTLKNRRSPVTLSEILRTTKFNNDETFLEACEAKYNEIMSGEDGEDAKPVEQVYCETGDNLTKIIEPLFGINDCANFGADKYQAIVGGAKAYCLSLATDPTKLTADNAMTKKLKKAFGSDIISKLTSTGAGTTVSRGTRDGNDYKFVDECARRYDEIMGILPVEMEFCENEDRLEKIIKPLYGSDKTCDNFTNAEYQAILGGAKAYCLSLVNDAKNNKLDVNTGVGAKLEKLLGSGIINQVKTGGAATPVTITRSGTRAVEDTNFVLACEEKYNEIVAGEDALGFTYRAKVATYADLPETCEQGDGYQVEDANQIADWQGLLYICNCHTVDNVQSCGFPARGSGVKFQGPKGEDGKSPEQTYCETNFATVNALYSTIENVNECNELTTEQYKAMMEGAKAYCLLIAQDFSKDNVTLKADEGIGKKLDKLLKVDGMDGAGIFSLRSRDANTPVSLSTILKTKTFNGGDSFLTACEKKYNEIMEGDDGQDAKSTEQTYCETNFSAVSALYDGFSTEADCANFTTEQYKAMMEGAKAYCLLIAKDFSKDNVTLKADEGIGKRLNELLKVGSTNDGIFSLRPRDANTPVDLVTVLKTTKFNGNKSFLAACEEKYNEIMSGTDGVDGADGEDAVKTWCRAHTLNATRSGAVVAKKLSAAKLLTAFKASSNSAAQIEQTQDATTGEVTGYFKTLEACIDAVNEDPTIMSGESSAEIQYNEQVKKENKEENKTFVLNTTTSTKFENDKKNFGSKMVTADNIGSKLAGNGVKNALQNAGFATKTEVKNDVNSEVFTLADFSRLLSSGGLKVDAAGTVKLADTTKNTDAANIVQKMETAKAKGGNSSSIKLTGLAATSNIATSVATVAAAANTAANASYGDEMTAEKCNQQDYMFWNTVQGEKAFCDKCPDGTDFSNPKGTTVETRCACPEKTQKVTFKDGEWQCIEAGEENECLSQDGTFWHGGKCDMCPKGTYFNDKTLDVEYMNENPTAPRCICEDQSQTFNPNAVTEENNGCSAAGSNECASKEMFWFAGKDGEDGHCEACPDFAPFDPEFGSCKCKDGDEYIFNSYEMSCRLCQDNGYEYNSETHSCKCDDGMQFNMQQWTCMEPGK